MARLKHSILGVSGLALFLISEQSAHALTQEQAALCMSAMSLKSRQAGLTISDKLVYQKANDWFRGQADANNSDAFFDLASQQRERLEEARLNGDNAFGKAVNGCREYYETSANDVPDTRIGKLRE